VPETKLRRTLSLFEVVFFATGVILGAGIYAVIGKAAGVGGNMLWLSFLLASITAVLTIFSYAELSSRYPEAGGEYSYVRKAIGDKAAITIGLLVVFCGVSAAATISIAFAGYLSELVELSKTLVALLIIAGIALVNIIGIRQSSVFNIIFTIIETIGLMFIIYTAWPQLGSKDYFELPDHGINGILVGAALCFFAFTGFEDVVKLAEETKNPEKNIPRGLFIASSIISVIYILVALSAISAVDSNDLQGSDSPLSLIAESRFGRNAAIGMAIIALFSTSNSLLSNMLGASRIIYRMGEDKLKNSWLAYVSPARKTPVFAILTVAILTGAVSLIGDIRKVALIANFFIYAIFLMINITVIYLRLRKPDEGGTGFKIPFTIKRVPVISVFAILTTLIMAGYGIYGLILGVE